MYVSERRQATFPIGKTSAVVVIAAVGFTTGILVILATQNINLEKLNSLHLQRLRLGGGIALVTGSLVIPLIVAIVLKQRAAHIFVQKPPATILSDHLYGMKSLEVVGEGKSKKVYRVKNTPLVIKSAHQAGGEIEEAMGRECIMYRISEALGFHVVPYTQDVLPSSEEGVLIAASCPELMGRPIILQEYIDSVKNPPENNAGAFKAVIFTWITGRMDAKWENSVVDRNGKVWEIDNELIGYTLKTVVCHKILQSHWLLKDLVMPIEKSLLLWVLALPDQVPGMEMEYYAGQTAANLTLLKRAIQELLDESPVGGVTFQLLRSKIEELPEG